MKYPISCLTKATKTHSVVAPSWFMGSRDIRNLKSFTKSFDAVGLADFTATTYMNDKAVVIPKLEHIQNRLEEDGIDHDEYDHLESMAASSIRYIIERLERNLTAGNALKKSIKDDRDLVLFKKGTTIKTIVKDLLLRSRTVSDDYPGRAFKELSAMVAGGKKKSHKVVFSTHPWDILTMSMRGIDSCMEWGSSHCSCLIGSVLDPYVGIIYSTNGAKTNYGSHMALRSVVRLIKKNSAPNGKFHLFVEGAYPHLDSDNDENVSATEMFRSVLSKRIKNNSRIESVVSSNLSHQYHVPYTDATRNSQSKTYFDSDLSYR